MKGEITGVHKTGYDTRILDNNGKPFGAPIFSIINNQFMPEAIPQIGEGGRHELSHHIPHPVVGDTVEIAQSADQHLIKKIVRRKNIVARFDHAKEKYQGFAANVHTVAVVTSCNREFSLTRIRRFLALSGDQDLQKLVILTKADTTDNPQHYIDMVQQNLPGVIAVAINALDKNDVETLKLFWDNDQSILLLGTSGVGKSTIINTLTGLDIKTNEVKSNKHFNKGKHTTSARTLYYMPCGRKIIDIPGVRIVGVDSDVARSSDIFAGIEEIATNCKFRNCIHKTEPGCAVKLAIENGELSESDLVAWREVLSTAERNPMR